MSVWPLLECMRAEVGDDPRRLEGLGELEFRALAVRQLVYRAADVADRGTAPQYEAALAKLLGTEVEQDIVAVGSQWAGYAARLAPGQGSPFDGHLHHAWLVAPSFSIRGGTCEIMRELISRDLLEHADGLPSSEEERAVVDAIEGLSEVDDPWEALVDGGWLQVAGTELVLAGLVAETLGRAGVALPGGVVWPLLFDPAEHPDRVGVAIDGACDAHRSKGRRSPISFTARWGSPASTRCRHRPRGCGSCGSRGATNDSRWCGSASYAARRLGQRRKPAGLRALLPTAVSGKVSTSAAAGCAPAHDLQTGRVMTSNPDHAALEQLSQLGLSQYEAQAYEGLLIVDQPQTGYALAKLIGMPQSKVYETLARLVHHGAAVKVSDDPARYRAVPAEQFLDKVADHFARNVEQARRALQDLGGSTPAEWPHVAWRLESQDEILDRAVEALLRAQDKVYLSVKVGDLGRLVDAVHDASMRGVEFVVLHFGPNPFPDLRGAAFQHLSTEGHLYPRHQAQHLAVVVDTERCLWGLALDGERWNAVTADDPTMARAIKSYIRHDIYVQRIFADFRDELTDRYGPALEHLADLTERTGRQRISPGDVLAG